METPTRRTKHDGSLSELASGPDGVVVAVKTHGGLLRFALTAAEGEALVAPVVEDLAHGAGVTITVEETGEALRLVGLAPWVRRKKAGRQVEQAVELLSEEVRIVYGYSPLGVSYQGEGGWLPNGESLMARNAVTVSVAALFVSGRLVDFKQDVRLYQSEICYMDGENCGGWAEGAGWAVVDGRPAWFSENRLDASGWAFVDAPDIHRTGAPGGSWGRFQLRASLLNDLFGPSDWNDAEPVEAIAVPTDPTGARPPVIVPGLRVRVPSLRSTGTT